MLGYSLELWMFLLVDHPVSLLVVKAGRLSKFPLAFLGRTVVAQNVDILKRHGDWRVKLKMNSNFYYVINS